MTSTNWDDFVNGLEGDDVVIETREDTREKFPCGQCAGTGAWSGGVNRHGNSKCIACQGRGYFLTSPEQRRKTRAATAKRKAKVKHNAREANVAAITPEEFVTLSNMTEWSSFAASLMTQHTSGKQWSEKQVASIKSMTAKVKANAEKREAEKKANAVDVDLSAIDDLFQAAIASGYKKPMYRAEGLRIKPGKGGALYVTTEDRMELGYYGEQPGYEGKIMGGQFHGCRKTAEDTPEKLLTIAKDPLAAALRYGKRTGTCSCCGRELTKHASIEAGIGPICREKWGL